MNNIKKTLALILCGLLLASAVACTKNADEPVSGNEPANETEQTETEENDTEKEDEAEADEQGETVTEYASLEELNERLHINLCHPPVMGVSDETFKVIETADLLTGEYAFKVNGMDYVVRLAATTDDISGVEEDMTAMYTDADGVDIILTENYKIARRYTLDGQYNLVAHDEGTLTEEQFEGIAGEVLGLYAENAEENAKYEVLLGEYNDSYSQRAVASVVRTENGVEITVHWGSSATEAVQWTMDAAFSEEGLLSYSACTRSVFTADENGEMTETETAETGAGYFDAVDGKLLWTGATDESCQSCVFEKAE